MTLEQYLADEKTTDAVERCLQRISEAAAKLGSELDTRYPDAPWRQARGIGNILRHRYDDVIDELIWKSIREDLPQLRQSAAAELKRLQAAAPPPSGYKLDDLLKDISPEDVHKAFDWGPDQGRERE